MRNFDNENLCDKKRKIPKENWGWATVVWLSGIPDHPSCAISDCFLISVAEKGCGDGPAHMKHCPMARLFRSGVKNLALRPLTVSVADEVDKVDVKDRWREIQLLFEDINRT